MDLFTIHLDVPRSLTDDANAKLKLAFIPSVGDLIQLEPWRVARVRSVEWVMFDDPPMPKDLDADLQHVWRAARKQMPNAYPLLHCEII